MVGEYADVRRIEAAGRPCFRGAVFARMITLLCEWHMRVRTRRDIARLDHRTIRDLGLSPSQLAFEAQKPFWRA